MLHLIRPKSVSLLSGIRVNCFYYARFSSNIDRIYEGALTKRIRIIKSFSLGSSFIGLAVQPALVNKIYMSGSLPLIIATASCMGFFTFVTPLLLHILCRRYVIYLDYNEDSDEYTATTFSLFLRKKKTVFKADDVRIPEIDRFLTSFFVHQKPMMVEMKSFRKSRHYIRIMGYDKPLDISLDIPNSLNKK